MMCVLGNVVFWCLAVVCGFEVPWFDVTICHNCGVPVSKDCFLYLLHVRTIYEVCKLASFF